MEDTLEEANAGVLADRFAGCTARLDDYCMKLTRSASAAEDLRQETFIRASLGYKGLSDPAKFESWVFRIARNAFFDLQKRRQAEPASDAGQEALIEDHPNEIELGAEERMHLHAAVAALDAAEREVLLLVDLCGFSYAEAGARAGLSTDMVRFRLHGIRRKVIRRISE